MCPTIRSVGCSSWLARSRWKRYGLSVRQGSGHFGVIGARGATDRVEQDPHSTAQPETRLACVLPAISETKYTLTPDA